MANGLLSNITPEQMAMLGMAGGLLGSSGYSARPISFGEAMGQGLLGGVGGYQTGANLQQQRELQEVKKEKLQMERDALMRQQNMQQALMERFGGSGISADNGGVGGNAFPLNFNDVMALKISGGPDLTSMYKLANEGIKQEKGAFYKDINGGMRHIPELPAGMTMVNGQVQPLPGYAQNMAGIEGERTGAQEAAKARYDLVDVYDPVSGSMVKVSREQALSNAPGAGGFQSQQRPEDIEYNKEMAKQQAANFKGFQDAGNMASKRIGNLNTFKSAMENINTGKLSEGRIYLSGLASSLGLKLDKNASNLEQMRSISIQMANEMREPGTGAFTDKDFENYLASVPEMSKTPEGNLKIIQTFHNKAARDQKEAELARKWQRDGRRLDTRDINGKDFYDYLDEFRASNSVIAGQ